MDDKTKQFSINEMTVVRQTLEEVYEALQVKGYDPIGQIIGYILSEDPTYITSFNDARKKIVKIDRYDLLQELVANYFSCTSLPVRRYTNNRN